MVWKSGNTGSIAEGAITDGLSDGEWLSGRSRITTDLAKSVAPPAQRAAAADSVKFYERGCLGLVGWIVGGAVLCTVLAAFPILILLVVAIAVLGGVIQMFRLLIGNQKQTADQRSAHDEWKIAFAEWQRTWLCLRCGESFIPEGN